MNILVTGAGSGIGYQTVLSLATEGNHSIIALSRNKQNLEKLQNEAQVGSGTGKVIILQGDITQSLPDDLITFLNKQGIFHLDGLLNNAGYLVNKDFERLTDDDFNSVYEINVFAPMRLIRLLLPVLRKSTHAHIVNISSLGGFQGSSKFKGLAAYSSSKAAIACLTECLAVEFEKDAISVNALALGAVDTEMLQQAFPGYKALVSADVMGSYIADFICNGHKIYNGKILPVSLASV